MENVRKTSFGFMGAAFVVLAGLASVNCSSKSNPAPGGKAGTGGAAGNGGSGGTGGAAGNSGSGGTGGAAGAAPDAGTGDGGTSCDASASSQDAGCMPCSTDPLFMCGPGQCIPFDNSVIPANIPRL
jgi:hypothetical protein